jgi:glycosyltransferase involved in cell wall biosynthesis
MTIEVYNAVGGAAFFQGLLAEWRSAGAEVEYREAVSETDYRARRGLAGRLALRWRMYAGYGWQCWSEARRTAEPARVRVVATNPFFAPALVARAGRGRVPTVNLLFDLYPEALVQTGRIAPDSWIAGRCAALTRYALRECAATVFLGERLRAHTEAVHGRARRAVVIPVGADGAPFRTCPPAIRTANEPLRILYSGQLGRMHDATTLLAAWHGGETSWPGLIWVFHATGAGYARLRREAGQRADVEWGGALTEPDWQVAMKRAHVALVTLAPGAERVVMPSKVYSALVAGQAVLAICPRASDLADLVRQHDCGWVVEPGDGGGLHQVLEQICRNPAELLAKRRRAFAAGHQFYDVQPVAAQWLELIRDLAEPGRTARKTVTYHEANV